MHFALYKSPVGLLKIFADTEGLKKLEWVDPSEPETISEKRSALLRAATHQLDEYFKGQRLIFDLPYFLEGTVFQKRAWEELQKIPFGETLSYSDQAHRLGDRKKCRAVGQANGRNPLPIFIPCHRVISSSGGLGGFSAGIERKLQLLAHEEKVRQKLHCELTKSENPPFFLNHLA